MTDSDGSRPEGTTTGESHRFPLTPDGIQALHDRFAPDIRAFLWGLTRDPHQADELLQATFARLVEAGHTVREESVRGWLFRVAHNEAMLWRRKSGVHARALQKLSSVLDVADRAEPWAKLIRTEEAERVRQALGALPPEQRQVVERRVYADETFATIAGNLGVPIGTVLTRMRLALTKLEKALRTENKSE